MGLFSLVGKAWGAYNQQEEQRWLRIMKRESLTCDTCNSLSVPVYGSADKYVCIKCGRRFSNRKHDIMKKLTKVNTPIQERYYDELTEKLK